MKNKIKNKIKTEIKNKFENMMKNYNKIKKYTYLDMRTRFVSSSFQALNILHLKIKIHLIRAENFRIVDIEINA